uniref:Putative SWI/SNF complex subunit SWI3A isoform X1 n=1 Tax=Davidia involucrata TaxID=16924 RepID=A0A5B6ZDT4_DAVIN
MESTQDPSLKPTVPADEPELDLYTIPTHSSWFSWDGIHETEKFSLREFFDGSSITRTPKIYKEYRDFIISKYREDPSRRLTYTEVRKSLVGDISLLHKVFSFLEKWGLINFGAPSADGSTVEEGVDRWKVRGEEGAPNGVRVVAMPNSLKPVMVPSSVSDDIEVVENGFKSPSLASYTDVYSEKEVLCGNCKEPCDSGHYKHTKEVSFIICVKCFKNGNYGENKSLGDFQFIDCSPNKGNHGAVWAEAETLLLLESVLKHGDDWELVAQNVKTKSKLDCISKLIELPFGELMLRSTHGSGRFWDTNGNMDSIKHIQVASSESQETVKEEDSLELKDESLQNGDDQGPPLKRKCTVSPSDAGSSLMKQVALISTMVGPHIIGSAAEAAVTALCEESQCTREIFDGDDNVADELGSPPQSIEKERVLQVDDSEMEERPIQLDTQETSTEKNAKLLTLQTRAATATALGAAAAHAKLLADQEDREIEYLVATLIEIQLKKLHCKIKHFDDLELIMEKEYAQMEELKEYIIVERMNVLRRIFNAGISRWRDPTCVKSQTGSVL